MAAPRVDAFAEAVQGVDAAVSRTTASAFAETLSEIVHEPAYGTPLPFADVSYEETPVQRDPTGADLATAATGVTAGTLGIAEYGSVVLQETGAGEELLGLFPDLHVVVVGASSVVQDMPAAFESLDEQFADGLDDAIIATGPSATADMGSLVTGVHGPRDVHVVVLEDR